MEKKRRKGNLSGAHGLGDWDAESGQISVAWQSGFAQTSQVSRRRNGKSDAAAKRSGNGKQAQSPIEENSEQKGRRERAAAAVVDQRSTWRRCDSGSDAGSGLGVKSRPWGTTSICYGIAGGGGHSTAREN